jgi:hypothetical protein
MQKISSNERHIEVWEITNDELASWVTTPIYSPPFVNTNCYEIAQKGYCAILTHRKLTKKWYLRFISRKNIAFSFRLENFNEKNYATVQGSLTTYLTCRQGLKFSFDASGLDDFVAKEIDDLDFLKKMNDRTLQSLKKKRHVEIDPLPLVKYA